MTLIELSFEYRCSAEQLAQRIKQLHTQLKNTDGHDRTMLENRIRALSSMHRQTRELAVLTGRYYDRGYYRNAKYTV